MDYLMKAETKILIPYLESILFAIFHTYSTETHFANGNQYIDAQKYSCIVQTLNGIPCKGTFCKNNVCRFSLVGILIVQHFFYYFVYLLPILIVSSIEYG